MSIHYKKLEKQWSKFIINHLYKQAKKKISKLKRESDRTAAWELHWERLSCNPNLTWEYIEDNLDKSWNWNKLTINLTINAKITKDIIQSNSDKPWDWEYLSTKSDKNIKNISASSNKTSVPLDVLEANWREFSENPNIQRESWIDELIWWKISNNPNITWDFVEASLDKDWDWGEFIMSSKHNMGYHKG